PPWARARAPGCPRFAGHGRRAGRLLGSATSPASLRGRAGGSRPAIGVSIGLSAGRADPGSTVRRGAGVRYRAGAPSLRPALIRISSTVATVGVAPCPPCRREGLPVRRPSLALPVLPLGAAC